VKKLRVLDYAIHMQINNSFVSHSLGISGRIRSVKYNRAVQTFAWGDWAAVKVSKGTLIGEGAFRQASMCTIDGCDELTQQIYVIKTFLSAAVERRIENLSAMNSHTTSAQATLELNMKASYFLDSLVF